MKISKIADIKCSLNPHGVDAHKIYDSENAVAVHMTIKPGESLKNIAHLLMCFFMFWRARV